MDFEVLNRAAIELLRQVREQNSWLMISTIRTDNFVRTANGVWIAPDGLSVQDVLGHCLAQGWLIPTGGQRFDLTGAGGTMLDNQA